MIYSDTVVSEKLIHKPFFILAMFVTVFLMLLSFSLGETTFAKFFEPITGSAEVNPLYSDFVVAFVLAVIFMINVIVIGLFSTRWQMIAVWIELTILALSFFNLFDLSIEFIQSKLWFLIAQGAVTTIYVSAISIVLASVIAIIGAIAKLSGNGFAFGIASFYVSFFRGLPLLMQLYLIYLGLPQLGFVIDAIPAGITALTLCYGAYMTEIFRSGIESINKGQWEASRALGFKFTLTMRRIILPQSLPVIIPPTGNQFIAMLKDSSLVSVIGVWELTFLASKLGSKTFQHVEMLVTVAMIYWILSIGLETVQAQIERHYNKKNTR